MNAFIYVFIYLHIFVCVCVSASVSTYIYIYVHESCFARECHTLCCARQICEGRLMLKEGQRARPTLAEKARGKVKGRGGSSEEEG
jgi:hypothetical protein